MDTFDRNGIEYRPLGRTGESVSIVGIGGWHLGVPEEREAVEIVRTALERGVNFLDNCWDYHDGESERRAGLALREGYRERAFVMTKIDGRTREVAARQIEESRQRLGVDAIDLLQLHEVIRPGDPAAIFAEGGAIEAVIEARDDGRVRHVGFTGHKDPQYLMKMLATAATWGFRFDAVQMPLNCFDAHFRSFEKQVLPALQEDGIGCIGMKPLGGRGDIPKSGAVSAVEALHYAMDLPVSTVVTGCDSLDVLHQALDAARSYQPLTAEEIQRLLDRTSRAAADGAFERYKTTLDHDGTRGKTEWLGVDFQEAPA